LVALGLREEEKVGCFAAMSECSLPEACWAAFVVAVLEQEKVIDLGTDANDGREADGAFAAEDAAPASQGLGAEDCDSAKESPPPKGDEEASFCSETTVPRATLQETPQTADADSSFLDQSFPDRARAVPSSPFRLDEDSFQTPPLTHEHRAAVPGAASFPSVPAADLARQHFEWAQELESVDQKQADLMMTQWKLVRNQTGMLAQQLVDLRKELDSVKHEQQQSARMLEQQFRENKDMQQRLGCTLQQSVQETHMSLARMRTEVQKRAAQDSEAQRRLQSIEAWAGPALRKLEVEVAELRGATEVSVKQVCQLKDQLLQQVDEWKSGHSAVMEQSAKWQDRVRKGLRALMNAHESHRNEVQQLQASLQEGLDQKFQTQLHEVHRRLDECGPQKDSYQDMENRINDMEAMLDSTLESHSKGVERKWMEMESRCQDLENGSKLLKVSLNQEIAARHSMVEVFDQMLKTEASKIATSVSEQVAMSQLDWKEGQKSMLEHLSQETCDRQEQARAMNADLASLGNGLGDRVGRLEGAWQTVRQDWREAKGSVRSLQGQLQQMESNLDTGLQGLRSELQSSLREERLKREVHGTGMAEQINAWEDFHKHLRQFYMSHTTLPAGDSRLRESEMSMGHLADLLRCSHDSEVTLPAEEVADILRASRASER